MTGFLFFCSFCGKRESEVAKLVAGPGRVFICDECVVLCYELVDDPEASRRAALAQLSSIQQSMLELLSRLRNQFGVLERGAAVPRATGPP